MNTSRSACSTRIARAHAHVRTYVRTYVEFATTVKGSGVFRSRERIARGQGVKAHFRRSRILTAVVNGPTVSIGVTTP